jgi:hypothetical protein
MGGKTMANLVGYEVTTSGTPEDIAIGCALMTDSLATVERCATVAQPSLADLGTYVSTCTGMDGEVLGEYIERNWNLVAGNALGLMFLVKEMKRKFKGLDRKKQVNGEYLTIRGCRSFKKWFSFTGKSQRMAYYLLETEEKKNERNAGRRTNKRAKNTFLARCADAKEKLAEFQRRRDNPTEDECDQGKNFKALIARTDPNPVINELFAEFLTVIAPDGYEVSKVDKGWDISKKKDIITITPEEQKAKRTAAAKKAAATKAANKAAAQPSPTTPAVSLGECELCCDGTLATEVVGVSFFNDDGYKYCAKCADLHRKDDRRRLMRQMSVGKVMGQFWTFQSLAKLGGQKTDIGDGEIFTYPTMEDYLARVKEGFLGKKDHLGNDRYDQAVVTEKIASIEKRMEKI